MDIVDEFFQLLEQHGYEVFDDKIKGGGLEFESLERILSGVRLTPKGSRKVRFIRSDTNNQFLYVLGSTSPKGFWGPDKNILDTLTKQTIPWALVLLHGSSTSGYWFPSATVLACVFKTEWRVGKDGYSYKVNAPNQVVSGEKFITPKKILTFIAQSGLKAV